MLIHELEFGVTCMWKRCGKANCQEPYAWLRHILERLPQAAAVEDFEALLP